MPHRQEPVAAPNMELRAARLRTPSPHRPGHWTSRAELADTVNAAIDAACTTEPAAAHLHVTNDWIGKLERGAIRWPHEQRRAALRSVLGAETDTELGMHNPRPDSPADAARH